MHTPWSSQQIKGTYLELDKRPHDHVLQTNARGCEILNYSAEVSAADDLNTNSHDDLEHGIPKSGIRKMVHIETSGF